MSHQDRLRIGDTEVLGISCLKCGQPFSNNTAGLPMPCEICRQEGVLSMPTLAWSRWDYDRKGEVNAGCRRCGLELTEEFIAHGFAGGVDVYQQATLRATRLWNRHQDSVYRLLE
jgi:hypothetical protein